MVATTQKKLVVELTEKELIFASLLAGERNAKDRRINKRISHRIDFTINLIGMIAELAFAKVSGFYPDTLFKYGDDGADFIFNGFKIDVKASNTPNPDLLIYVGKKIADVYVMSFVDPEDLTKVEFQGYFPGQKVEQCEVVNLGYGDTYKVRNQDLSSMSILATKFRNQPKINV